MAQNESPTVPRWLNIIMRIILRSPLHGLVSDKLMLISFEGKKTHQKFTTPVSYMQTGNEVTLFTHARWWRNLVGGATVTLRIKGRDLFAQAEVVAEDKATVAEKLAQHLLRNHFDARFYHVTYDADGQPNSAAVERGAEGVVMVRLRTA